jgi:hypothetical protein
MPSTRRRNVDKLQSLLDPSDATIEIVKSDRQASIIGVQPGNLAFKPAEADDNLVQLLALRCLLRANRSEHVQDEIGSLVAHKLLTVTNNHG